MGENRETLFFGELLNQFRRRKKLTQRQLAERLEVTRETVSLWERGNYKPEAEGVLYHIVHVLHLTDLEQQQLFEAYTVTALVTSFHHPPSKRNPYFTGRSAQLRLLHTLLSAGKQVALTQAISGLGGIGKTQLALEYAYRYQKSYHDIFWASADTEEELMASYMQFAYVLHLPEAEEADQNKVKAAVCRWLREHTNWLLVVDNIEDLRLLPSFVPEDRQGAVLLTTRRQVTEPVAQALELAVLSEDEAALFLLKRTKVLALDASLEGASDNEVEAARAITRLLDNLPLALDQAGAYILETRCSFAEYGMLFRTYRDHLLQRRIGESIPTDHPDSVRTTFRLNVQQVQQRNRAAVDLLHLCAYLAPDAIAEEVLTEGASFLGAILSPIAGDTLLLNQAIEVLGAYSLVRREPGRRILSIHRLVQAVLQEQLSEAERHCWAERAILALNAAFPDVQHSTWLQCERLLPHALVCANWIEHEPISAAHMLHKAGTYLRERGQYSEAEPLLAQALALREQYSGVEHLDTARSLDNLAVLYRRQGKHKQAEPLSQRALTIYEQQLGTSHPDTARSLTSLASIYLQQGKYEQAESSYQRALSIREQHLGTEHLDTARSLVNLAILYRCQGKYEQAELLYQRALAILERHLGTEHPDIAQSLGNLGVLYWEQGKYEQAESSYQRALSIQEHHLGAEHPSTVMSLGNLAILYAQQGKYEQAEPLCQRVFLIQERHLGAEHPDTAMSMHNLAGIYLQQGKHEQAEPWCQRALAIQERHLGTEHPDTALSLSSLASIYLHQGKYEQAEPLYQRAIVIREQHLGAEHPLTADSLGGLAELYQHQGKYGQAEPLFQQALAILEKRLGAMHPNTQDTRRAYAAFLRIVGRDAEAAIIDMRASISQEANVPPQEDIPTQ